MGSFNRMFWVKTGTFRCQNHILPTATLFGSSLFLLRAPSIFFRALPQIYIFFSGPMSDFSLQSSTQYFFLYHCQQQFRFHVLSRAAIIFFLLPFAVNQFSRCLSQRSFLVLPLAVFFPLVLPLAANTLSGYLISRVVYVSIYFLLVTAVFFSSRQIF